MATRKEPLTEEVINSAIKLLRQMVLRIMLITMLGMAASLLLGLYTNTHFLGQGLGTWGMGMTVLLLALEMYWDGFRIGLRLRNPLLFLIPAVGILMVNVVIAHKAAAIGMRPSPFMRPLRPMAAPRGKK